MSMNEHIIPAMHWGFILKFVAECGGVHGHFSLLQVVHREIRVGKHWFSTRLYAYRQVASVPTGNYHQVLPNTSCGYQH